MSKDDILAVFETDFTDPGSYKSGEYLAEHILRHAKQFLETDRRSLVNVLSDWINMKTEPHTMLAVYVARELGISELLSDIEALKKAILNKEVFALYYIRNIDRALDVLTKHKGSV